MASRATIEIPARMVALTAALTALAGSVGCDEPVRPGTVEVNWRTGRLTCAEAGVSAVRTELYGFGTIEPVGGIERVCPEGGAVLDDVLPGDYTVLLAGFDVDGCWTHVAREDITLGDGAEVTLSLPLLRRTRPLYVRWPFVNELDCTGNGVEQVQITIDVEDRFTWSEAFVCPGLAVEIPTDVPAGDISVQIMGLDSAQRPVALGLLRDDDALFTETPCDDRIEVRVPLTLCFSSGCEDERPR